MIGIFKRSVFLLVLLNLSLIAFSQRFRIICSDEPLNRILIGLRDTTDLMVSFDDHLLSGFRLTVDRQFESFPETLSHLFKDLPLNYEIITGVYVIYTDPLKEVSVVNPVLEITPVQEISPVRELNIMQFNKNAELRKNAAIARMNDIRRAQRVYRSQRLKYTGSFDTLVNFLKHDSFLVVNAIGMIPASLIDSVKDLNKAKEIAVRRGLIQGITYKVAVIDSIFPRRKSIVDSLRFVPYSDKLDFDMKAGENTTRSGQSVKVLEVSVLFETLFKGLEPQLVHNYIDGWTKVRKFPGLKFGSFEEATLNGNWE